MGVAAEYVRAQRAAAERARADALAKETAAVLERTDGARALVLSLAEHPEWDPASLLALAAWRLALSLGDESCVDLVGEAEIGRSHAVIRREPDTGERIEVAVTPQVRPAEVDRALSVRASVGERSPHKTLYHPMQVTGLDPRTKRRTLPLVDPNDSDGAKRLVEACGRVDLEGMDRLADAAFSLRYGMASLDEAVIGSGIANAAADELAQRLAVACERLRRACRLVDEALGVCREPQASADLHDRFRRAQGADGTAAEDGRGQWTRMLERRLEGGAARQGEDGKAPGAEAAGEEAPTSAHGVMSAVKSALEKRSARPRGRRG